MENPKKVALETARQLAQQPSVLVAATASQYPEQSEPAIARLAVLLEVAIRRCMCRDFPKGD